MNTHEPLNILVCMYIRMYECTTCAEILEHAFTVKFCTTETFLLGK